MILWPPLIKTYSPLTSPRLPLSSMAEGKRPHLDLDAKWDAGIDITIRRFVYSSLAGAFSGFLLFRSPTTRWASVAFGAGVGIGTAYTECSYLFDGSPPKWPSQKVSAAVPVSSREEGN